MAPVLVDTSTAVVFILRCQNLAVTKEHERKVRDHIYYLAKAGRLTRHGGTARGTALWDLYELVEPYRRTTELMLP